MLKRILISLMNLKNCRTANDNIMDIVPSDEYRFVHLGFFLKLVLNFKWVPLLSLV